MVVFEHAEQFQEVVSIREDVDSRGVVGRVDGVDGFEERFERKRWTAVRILVDKGFGVFVEENLHGRWW